MLLVKTPGKQNRGLPPVAEMTRPQQTRSDCGFTLIEVVMIIVILGIIAAVAIPRFGDMSNASKEAATQQELAILKKAIVGDASITAGGKMVNRGFEGDVGFVPSRLQDLVTKPDSVSSYNPLTRLGWNGPYIDGSNGLYLTDAWSSNYVYTPSLRVITSVGGGDTISVTF
ncbi:MAG TPA: prepilin-type N-terminal cleavage/methylation domain-containing protein [candidate division Zixibacteria bacterium]|nr:prepilin-type N-terminal cleavage/methylation domain-containing protein [candidate division Zixibacteria bacterium]